MSANFGDWGVPATKRIEKMVNDDKAAKLAAWVAAKETAKEAVEMERLLRNEIVELFSNITNPDHAGTENVPTAAGKLKIVHKLNYTLGDGDAVEAALDKIEKTMEGGNVIAERLVSWKPDLSLSNYKLLTSVQKAIIDTVLTIKPATKTVSFEPVVG